MPFAIDAAGDVVGSYQDSSGLGHGFIRTASGTIIPFDAPGVGTGKGITKGTMGTSINSIGTISGGYADTNGVYHWLILPNATGTTMGTITTFTAQGAGTTGTYAGTFGVAINTAGTVAGEYTDTNSVIHGFLASPLLTATTTTLAASQTSSVYGEPSSFTATVSSSGGAPANGESVLFMNGTTQLGSATLSSGTASFTTTELPVGTDSVTAVYSGDTTLAGSTSTAVSQAVAKASSTTTLTSSPNPSGVGQSVSLTATVSGQFGGTATGTVTFSNGTTTLGSAPLSGNQAVYTSAALAQGTDSISAVYSGDANFSGSTSNTLSQSVDVPDFTIALSPTTISVQAGASGTTTITLQDMYGFNSNVSFACSGLPAGAACSFTQSTVPTPAGVSYSTLTVTTTSTSAALKRNSSPLLPAAALATLLCCFGFRKRRSLLMLILLAAGIAGLGAATGCGSGGTATQQRVTSTVTVTATSGSLSHTATFSLTVN